MLRLIAPLFAVLFLLASTACNKTEAIEPQSPMIEEATPTADDRLGPCGQLSGTVRAYSCGLVLEADNGKVYELPMDNDFEVGSRLSYQLQSAFTEETECTEVLRVSFSCLQAWN